MLFKQISQARNRNNNKTNKDISPTLQLDKQKSNAM